MKILVLSNSDTVGAMAAGPTWTERVRDTRPASDLPVTLTTMFFAPVGAGAASYVARKVVAGAADLVLVPIGTYAFTVGFVSKRVERLFGTRVAARYRRLERGFDQSTRGRGGVRSRLNGLARTFARRVIGTAPLATVSEVSNTYEQIFGSLARLEQALVVVVTYPPEGGLGRRHLDERRQCFKQLREAANRHHFAWVDGTEAVASLAPGEEAVTPDGFHLSPAGHRAMAEAVSREIDAASLRTPDRST